ncbi:MAG TPA: S41 family peptidase [Mobilitalea sp.]|nr:S41 family peptidase [Mobilitalea sp.]
MVMDVTTYAASNGRMEKSMRIRKVIKQVCVTAIILGILFTGLYVTYKLYFNPYRGTVKTVAKSESLSEVLTKEQAMEDISFIMSKLKERHPACMEEIPAEVKAQYDKEISKFNDDVSILTLWQAASRILSKMKDAHTNVNYYGADTTRLPLTFVLDAGILYCSGDSFSNYIVEAINTIPWQDLYHIYLTQFSYELENYAGYNFAAKLPYKLYLQFIGVDTSSDIDITFLVDNKEKAAIYSFEMPKAREVIAKEPFVSYQIDKDNSLGILSLLSCDNNAYYRETLKEFFTEIKKNKIQTVAVDLRNNGGGNSTVANEFIRYLDTDKFYVAGGVEVRYGPWLQKFKKSPTKNRRIKDLLFTGNVYALTSDVTFSSAKMFANMLSDNHLGKLIGEIPGNMPASYGDILYFQTPNAKLLFSVSYKYFGRIDETKADQPLIPDSEVKSEEAIDKLYDLIGSK